jgi:hypothetical protein
MERRHSRGGSMGVAKTAVKVKTRKARKKVKKATKDVRKTAKNVDKAVDR